MPDIYDDGVDEFSKESAEPEPDRPVAGIAGIAVIVACLTFVFTVYMIGRNALRHTPEYELTHMPLVVAVDIAIFLFTVFALAKSQAMVGTVARGMALAAVALSFLASIIAGYSWYIFVLLVKQSHG